MHAVLAFEIAVGKVAFDVDGDGFDAGFLAVEKVGDGGLVAVLFGPAQVHAHEHGCPVLAFGAAGSGVDFQHHSELVFLAPEHVAQLQGFDLGYGFGIERVDLFFGHEFLFVEVKRQTKLFHGFLHVFISVDPCLEILDLLHLYLSFFGVFPEVGHVGAEFFFLYLNFLVVDVKDTSSAQACAQRSLLAVPELSSGI